MILSPSRFLATEQCEGQDESSSRRRIAIGQLQGPIDDDNRVIGFANSLWAGVLIWAILAAVVIYYSNGGV